MRRILSRNCLFAALLCAALACNNDEPSETASSDVTAAPDTSAAVDAAPTATSSGDTPQILFGDLHVHSTHSLDAMVLNAPILNGRGLSGPAVRCDYARFCSQLDFWSITDHPETSEPKLWGIAKDAVRTCNDLEAGDTDDPQMVSFVGWEWTQTGADAGSNWGHKNVLFQSTANDELPARPIAAPNVVGDIDPAILGSLDDLAIAADPENTDVYTEIGELISGAVNTSACEAGVDSRQLPADCAETAVDPAALYEKLDQWGFDALVIPHGNTWGAHHPVLANWAPQLNPTQHVPKYERLAEIHSGHGTMEHYRTWRAVDQAKDGTLSCPEPSDGFVPCCWRAGELTRERDEACVADPAAAACTQAVEAARQKYVDAGLGGAGDHPDATPEDWQDCGQCTDCYTPAFNHRPGFSLQAAYAMSHFAPDAPPLRYRFGIIGSTDSHRAGAGAGYKEGRHMSDVIGPSKPDFEGLVDFGATLLFPEWERQNSYFYSGGLVAVHSEGRSREAIWSALKRREVYATSGERMLLWFDLVDEGGTRKPMGSEVGGFDGSPTFEVRAMGAFQQAPGCPQDVLSRAPDGFVEQVCYGECYNPTDVRQPIDRIEIVKITPQIDPGEPLESLIVDPWKTVDCDPSPEGCKATFHDPDYAAAGRPAVYYARVLQAPTPQFNAAGIRCERDEAGRCIGPGTLCPFGYEEGKDDCLTPAAERAWSSPIFLDPTPKE